MVPDPAVLAEHHRVRGYILEVGPYRAAPTHRAADRSRFLRPVCEPPTGPAAHYGPPGHRRDILVF